MGQMAHIGPQIADTCEMSRVEDVGPEAEPGERDFDAEFERAVAEINAREAEHRAAKGLWLSHHWPEEFDRCVLVRGRHVCRRCLLLYPIALAVAAASLAGVPPWPASFDPWLIWLLCLPATFDFVTEQLGLVEYSVRRQTVATLLLAPALGRGIGYELDDSWSWEFWGPVLVFCTIWFLTTIVGRSREGSRMDDGKGALKTHG